MNTDNVNMEVDPNVLAANEMQQFMADVAAGVDPVTGTAIGQDPVGTGGVQQTPAVVVNGTAPLGQFPTTPATVGLGLRPTTAVIGSGHVGPSARVPPAMMPAEKPEKFNGLNFKRWQQKMKFYLTTLGLSKYLTEDPPLFSEDSDVHDHIQSVMWHDSDYLCRNYVMNGLADSLYNVYTSVKTAKELWESLDYKYRREDAGSKKFIVGKFLEYKMTDSRTVVSQMQELQLIFHEIASEGMTLSETFQVAAVIEKLPPSWRDFKNYLKHKGKEMNLEEIYLKLRIEEENRGSDRKLRLIPERANVVEHDASSKKKKSSNKLAPKGGTCKKKGQPKFQGKCFNCGQTGHKANECPKEKKKKKEVNIAEADDDEDFLVAVISELNLVDSNDRDWWLDTGATRHICSTESAFSTLNKTGTGEKVYMGNSATSEVKGKGTVVLKFTTGKKLKLNDVLFVPDVKKNLISGTVLDSHGFKMTFQSQKVVLVKNDMYVGRG